MHGLGLVVVAVGVIGITVACYWCKATFAMTLEPDASGSIRDAFTSACRHAHFIMRGASVSESLTPSFRPCWSELACSHSLRRWRQ